jgi:transcriptional regulator with XRE-family HTH domain
MKKYKNLGELLLDYRVLNNMSQLDMASTMNVDTRTISRWEKNETLVKPEKEKELVERLFIPYQVIRNLNTDQPIPIYYNPDLRTYSLSAIMQKAAASWYKSDLPIESESIRLISKDTDIEFIADIQQINKNAKPIKPALINEAAKILPELNLVLSDQSGFYAGHITILPLKYNAYLKLREREIDESAITLADLSHTFDKNILVFYFYSLYADNLENAYSLMNRVLGYFREKQFKNYIFAGLSSRKNKIELLREMGLKIIWEATSEEIPGHSFAFLEGNFDMFLFGKMS